MDSQAKLDELFYRAKSETKASTFGSTKALFVSSVGVKKPIHVDLGSAFLIFKNLSIMIGLVSLLGIGFFTFYSTPTNGSEKNTGTKQEHTMPVSFIEKQEGANAKNDLTSVITMSSKVDKLPFLNANKSFTAKALIVDLERTKKPGRSISSLQSGGPFLNVPYSFEYRFLELTEQEKKNNNKSKKKMLKTIYKMFKSNLTLNPAGKYSDGDEQVSINAFSMMAYEISNLDYRVFLFDLLIDGKKNEFMLAKPEQHKWTEVLGNSAKPMLDHYFSNDAYNLYPVVNIPPKGAEMFCVWLSENMKKNYPDSDFKEFRIPSKDEWLFAATMNGKFPTYPWGGSNLYNASGCFLANFNGEHSDSIKRKNECFSEEDLKDKVNKVSSFDGAMYTAKVFSYNPNQRNIFNLSGNAAELVYINADKEFGTCGGGWMNTADEIKLNAADPHKGNVEAHPNIGFRIVSTYIGEKSSGF